MLRGSRRALSSWSRRALLYPAFVVLALVALGGAFETVVEAATSNNRPSGSRTYLVRGHHLYLRCLGSGSPTVVLFSGLGERTTSWAWVQGGVVRRTRVCAFDRAGQSWSGKAPGARTRISSAADMHACSPPPAFPGLMSSPAIRSAAPMHLSRDGYPKDVAGVALVDSAHPVPVRPADYPGFYSIGGAPRRCSDARPSGSRPARRSARGSFARLRARRRRARSVLRRARCAPTGMSSRSLRTVFRQAKALTSLGGRPLLVLTADLGAAVGLF